MAKRSEKKSPLQRGIEYANRDSFVPNAFILFNNATEIARERFRLEPQMEDQQILWDILDQMLHSLLFLGNMISEHHPTAIFCDTEILVKTMSVFPNPFDEYKTHVARRTPFSFLLELLTRCYGQNEGTVKDRLSEILDGCIKSGDLYPLISTVICVCEISGSRYYGGSLSFKRDMVYKIMTAVSCVHVWHPKVSSAVMSVFPDGAGEPHSINLPDTVQCRAFAMEDLEILKPPCKTCNELYSLPDPTTNPNRPGNCAETEAISNLLSAEDGVSNQTTITGGVYDKSEIRQKMENYFNTNMQNVMNNRVNNYNIAHFYPN